MNLNLDNLVKRAVPESKDRNVRIVSDNMTGSNYRDANFLSKDFPRSPPKLYITGEGDDFDELTLAEWRAEGFDVEYFSLESCGGSEGYVQKLKSLSGDGVGFCEKFGIIGERLRSTSQKKRRSLALLTPRLSVRRCGGSLPGTLSRS